MIRCFGFGTAGRWRVFSCVLLMLLPAAARALSTEAVRGGAEVLPREVLLRELEARRSWVPEFVAIREQAMKQGLRVWLFGGTAAGYAAYVADDLLREANENRPPHARLPGGYPAEHFAYLLPQIFRPRQDLDLVFDGSTDDRKLSRVEGGLAPYLPGTDGYRCGAELRWLRRDYGTKIALLDNPEALRQDTDSASIGFIELTDPPPGEPVVRDLHRWGDADGKFVETFASGIVRYLPSPEHGTTARAQAGHNPPLLAVMRWLGKAFQYRLQTHPADEEAARLVVGKFDFRAAPVSGYGRGQIEKLGIKLYLHAADVHRAYRVTAEMGLRDKLVATGSRSVGGAGWWAGREPLPGFDLGAGYGQTAREAGLDVVAHDASNLDSFEALLRAPAGVVNALKSRQVTGERAVHGDGFYVAKGTEGAWRSGFNVRFRVRPDAREGTDFRSVGADWYVILNREILEVIPEPLERDPVRFLELLPKLEASDAGAVQRLFRGYRAEAASFGPAVRKAVVEKLKTALAHSPRSMFLTEFVDLLGEAPFTEDELRDLVASMPHEELVYRLAVRRALRASRPEEAKLLRVFLPADRRGKRRWLEAVVQTLPADYVGVAARSELLAIVRETNLPWWGRASLLQALLWRRGVADGESVEGRVWRNRTWLASAWWKSVAVAGLAVGSFVYGSFEGIHALSFRLGYPERGDGGYASEANLRMRARKAGVEYEDYVKFAAPLGVGNFPSFPHEMPIEQFLPLIRPGDRTRLEQVRIDWRAAIFRQLVDDWVRENPPEAKGAYNTDYQRRWLIAARTAAFIALHGETPVENPRAAWEFITALSALPSGYASDWRFDGYSKGPPTKAMERALALWRKDPAYARCLTKAVAEASQVLGGHYGLHRLWDRAEKEAKPDLFLANAVALSKGRGNGKTDYRYETREGWRDINDRPLLKATELSMTQGLSKIETIAKDMDVSKLGSEEEVAFLERTSLRPDWKAYLESRASLRESLNVIGNSSLDGNKLVGFVDERLAAMEPKHPCGDLLAVYAHVARLAKVHAWDKGTEAKVVDDLIAKWTQERDLGTLVDRYEVAAAYARKIELPAAETRALCDIVCRRPNVRDAIAGHFTVLEVTAGNVGSGSAVRGQARQAALRAAKSSDPIEFASAYRTELRKLCSSRVPAGAEAQVVEKATTLAARRVP